MEVATTREAVNLSNNTKAITPKTLKDVLVSYPTIDEMNEAIAQGGGGGGGGGGLVNDVRVNGTSVVTNKIANVPVPTSLSQLSNDDNYVQTVDGLIPSALLPSYVDDVINGYLYNNTFYEDAQYQHAIPAESGKIYIDIVSELTYRWSGSSYVEISKSLALGETSSTAYRGDRGKAAYDHSILTGNPHGLALTDLSITVSAAVINYLDGLSENIVTALNKKLNLSGGTMTGDLILNQDPFTDYQAATKRYVDNMYAGVSVRITQNVTNTKFLAEYIDGYIERTQTDVDTVTQLTNKMEGYDTYIECPHIKFLQDVEYYSVSERQVFKQTEDVLYKESVEYYTRTGEGTELDPYVYTLLVAPTDYNINDIIPLDNPRYNQHTESIFTLLNPGVDYLIGADTYKQTEDEEYLANKDYYRKGDDTWTLLKPNTSGEGDYNIGDPTTEDDYEFDNVWIKKRTEGLNQTVQNNKKFIKEQSSTNAEINTKLTSVDTTVNSLNTSINGGEIYVQTEDREFQTGKTYYYLDEKDKYKVYTDYNDGDLIITKQEYQCSGEETGSYFVEYNDVKYYFTMPSDISDDDKLIFDIENEKLYLNEIDQSKEITTASSGTGTELIFLDIKDLILYETQLQKAMSEVIDDNYSKMLGELAKYATTDSVTQKIQTLQETTTSSYKRIDIQNILKGIGYVLTDDSKFKAGKKYYTIINDEYVVYTNYNVDDPIPIGESGFNETIYEFVEVTSMTSKSGTFNDQGLTIAQYDENDHLIGDSTSRLDSSGLDVRAIQNGTASSEPTLYAGIDPENPGESVVKATNINVKTYLYAAEEHLRIEKYRVPNTNIDGWGGFYI